MASQYFLVSYFVSLENKFNMKKNTPLKSLFLIGFILQLNTYTCVGVGVISPFLQTVYSPYQFNPVSNLQYGSVPIFPNLQKIGEPISPGQNPFVIPNFNVPAFKSVPTVNALPMPNITPLLNGNLPEQFTPLNMFQPKLYQDVSSTSPTDRLDVAGDFCVTLEGLKDKSKFPPAITVFKRQVALQVQKSQVISKLINIEQEISPSDFAWVKFYIVMLIAGEIGFSNPSQIAHLSSRYIAQNRDRILGEDIIATYSSALAKFMYSRGALRCENAANLAQSFSSVLEDAANRVTVDKCPISKIAAFSLGYSGFLTRIGLFNAQNVLEIGQRAGDEWSFLSPHDQNQLVPIPPVGCSNCNPNLKPDDNLCNLTSKAIQIFQTTFMRLIQSLPIFRSMLTLNEFSLEDFYKASYIGPQFLLQSVGSTQSAVYAEFASRALKDCKAFTPELFLRVRGAFMAKFLWNKEILNEGNAYNLAEKLIQNLAENVQKSVNLQFPISKLVAMTATSKSFPIGLGIPATANTAHTMAYLIGNELRCQCSYHG